jgi:hypothetical protein
MREGCIRMDPQKPVPVNGWALVFFSMKSLLFYSNSACRCGCCTVNGSFAHIFLGEITDNDSKNSISFKQPAAKNGQDFVKIILSC